MSVYLKRLQMLAAVFLGLTGCTLHPVQMQQMWSSPQVFDPSAPLPTGKGMVYILRSQQVLASGCPMAIYFDKMPLGSLDRSSFYQVQASPGKHVITWILNVKRPEVTVNVEAGKNYYWQLQDTGPAAEQLSEAEGRARLGGYTFFGAY